MLDQLNKNGSSNVTSAESDLIKNVVFKVFKILLPFIKEVLMLLITLDDIGQFWDGLYSHCVASSSYKNGHEI